MTAFRAALRAESFKLTRRRPLLAAAAIALGLGIVAPLSVFLSAQEMPASIGTGAGLVPSLAELAEAGGATSSFGVGISFVGGITVALVGASVAGELSHGTLRTLLLHQPNRIALLTGKVAGLLLVAWTTLAAALVVGIAASVAGAAIRDVPTTAWWTGAGLSAGVADYATAAASLAGWAILGTALAAILRSVPLTLGVGVAWIGPLEHITSDAWSDAFRWYPGLLLENVLVGGTPQVGLTWSLTMSVLYGVIAATGALLVVRRVDVTS